MRLLEIDGRKEMTALRLKLFQIIEEEAKKLFPGISVLKNRRGADAANHIHRYTHNGTDMFVIKWYSTGNPKIFFQPNQFKTEQKLRTSQKLTSFEESERIQNIINVIKLLNKVDDKFPLDEGLFDLAIHPGAQIYRWGNVWVHSFTELIEILYFDLQEALKDMGYGKVPMSTVKQMFDLS